MEWKMHTDTEIQPSVGSLTTDIQGQLSRLAAKMRRWITSLVRKARRRWFLIGLRIGFTIRFHPPRCLQELRHSDSGGTASVQDCSPALLCFFWRVFTKAC